MRINTGLMLAAIVCAGSTACSTSVDGAVAGRKVDAVESVAMSGVEADDAWLDIAISDFEGLCDSIDRNTAKSGGTRLSLGIFKWNRGSRQGTRPMSIGLGTFAILREPTDDQFAAGVGTARLIAWDAVCHETFSDSESLATSGSITISEITSSKIEGSFSLTFDGGTLKGKFTAPVCDANYAREDPAICNK